MLTEPTSPVSSEDLRNNFERLQSDLAVVQNELGQALDVWRTIVTNEKQEFKKLLEDHEKTWIREDLQWQKDRQTYGQKVQELEALFQQKITATEQNAVRALNELDAAWQQERQRWQETLTQQSASHHEVQQRVAELTEENAQSQARQAESQNASSGEEQKLRSRIADLEAQVAEWHTEKAAWQQTLSERISEVLRNEGGGTGERERNFVLMENQQRELQNAEQRLSELEQAKQAQSDAFAAHVNTLEAQISALHDFIHQLTALQPSTKSTPRPNAALTDSVASMFRDLP